MIVAVYLFWPEEPCGIYSRGKFLARGQARARLQGQNTQRRPGIFLHVFQDSLASELPPIKKTRVWHKGPEQDRRVKVWYVDALSSNISTWLGARGGFDHTRRVTRGRAPWMCGWREEWGFSFVPVHARTQRYTHTHKSLRLQEHHSPQGVSRAKMNEPPVDSLPSWQMAQDRQGIGE